MRAPECLGETRAFIDEARAVGVLDPSTHARLAAELDRRAELVSANVVAAPSAAGSQSRTAPPPSRGAGAGSVPAHAGTGAAAPGAAGGTVPGPFPSPAGGIVPAPSPGPAEGSSRPRAHLAAPGRRRLREALASELAVHGLAYLGVLLLFAAALGFTLFAFTGVSPVGRVVGAFAVPGALATAAALLLTRGAPLVGRGLEWLAGAVFAVALLAVLGEALEPGGGLVAGWTATLAVLAVAYAALARRWVGSALRWLVGPLGWLAVAVVTLAFTGEPTAWQAAAGAGAIATTLAVLRDVPAGRLRAAGEAVAASSAGVALVVALLLAWRDGWPPLPMLAAGVATLAVLELVAAGGRMGRAVVAWQVATAIAVIAALAPGWGLEWAGVAGVAATMILLVARAPAGGGWARRPLTSAEVAVAALLGSCALVAAAGTAVTLAIGWGIAAVWGHLHQAVRGGVAAHATRAGAVDVLARIAGAFTPVGALIGVAIAWSPSAAFGVAAVTVAATAIAARVRHLDAIAGVWPAVLGTLVAAPALIIVSLPWTEAGEGWPAAALFAATGLAVVLARVLPLGLRAWWAVPMWLLAVDVGSAATGLDRAVIDIVLASLAGGVVVVTWVGATWMGRMGRAIAPHAAGVGHLALLVVVGSAAQPTAVPLLVAFAGAWLATAAAAGQRSVLWPAWLGAALALGHLLGAASAPDMAREGAALVWVGVGLATAAAGGARRRRSGAGVAGATLVVVAAALAGTGWLALACVLGAGAAGAASWQARTLTARGGWAATSALAGAAAWVLGLDAAGITGDQAANVSTIVAGVAAVLVAVLARTGLSRDLAGAWTAITIVGVGVAALVTPDAQVAAAGLALAAAGAGLAAAPVGATLREVAAVVGVVAGIAALAAVDPDRAGRVAAAVTVGLLLAAAGLAWWRERPDSPSLRPIALAAGLVSVLGVGLATVGHGGPEPRLLAVALLAVAVQASAAGLLLRAPWLLAAAPPVAAAAWLVVLGDLVPGGLVAATAPIGLALLAEAEIARWSGGNDDAARALEAVGVGTIGLPILVEIAVGDLAYALVGVLAGIGLALWGAVTRVRRRLSAGAVLACASVGLVVAVPVVRVLPELTGGWLWAALAAIGATLIAGATGLERGRTHVAGARRRLADLLEGWD